MLRTDLVKRPEAGLTFTKFKDMLAGRFLPRCMIDTFNLSRCEITLVLAQPIHYQRHPGARTRHFQLTRHPPKTAAALSGHQASNGDDHSKFSEEEVQPGGMQGYSKLREFLSDGIPLESLVRRLRSHPSEETVGQVQWLERMLEKEIEKGSESLEQLVTGSGQFSKVDKGSELRKWVSRIVRSKEGKYYKGESEKEELETPNGSMTELGVAVLNAVLKQFLELAYTLANSSDDSVANTIRVPGYLVLPNVNQDRDEGAETQLGNSSFLSEALLNKVRTHNSTLKPKDSEIHRDETLLPKEDGPKDLTLLPWKNLVRTKPGARECSLLKRLKSQPKLALAEYKKICGRSNMTSNSKLSLRQKMNNAVNSMRIMNDLKTVVSNRAEKSMMHKYRRGEGTKRHQLRRQWGRIRRSDVSDREQDGIKLELKELLNSIVNKSDDEKSDEDELSDDASSLPKVAFALPKNLLVDSTTPGNTIKVSRYHCHKFMPSCAKYAGLCRKNHGSQTSELVNFLLMLHSNNTKPMTSGANDATEAEVDYGCYDYNDALNDEEEEEDYEEGDDGVDFGNPFQELKLTTQHGPKTTLQEGGRNISQIVPSSTTPIISNAATTTKFESLTTTTIPPRTEDTLPKESPNDASDSVPTPSTKFTALSSRVKVSCQSTPANSLPYRKSFFGELRMATKAIPISSGRKSHELHSCQLSRTIQCETTTTTECTNTIETSLNSGQAITNFRTYSCPIVESVETQKSTLPPMKQYHELITMVAKRPTYPPPCRDVEVRKNDVSTLVQSESGGHVTDNNKVSALKKNGRCKIRRHRIRSRYDPRIMSHHHRRYHRRKSKPNAHSTMNGDQTGLLAILADPSMPGATRNGLWRYIPYRMVQLQDVNKLLGTKRAVIRDLDRLHFHRDQTNLLKPVGKILLTKSQLRRGRKNHRRRFEELEKNGNDNDQYDDENYESYIDEQDENAPYDAHVLHQAFLK